LLAKDANPDERDDYAIPHILDYCEEHRRELVIAILTMIKAWFQAGKPAPKNKISKADSFGNWIKMVGGILDFADIEGWQQNREDLRSKNNEEAKEWERFLATWTECYGEMWKKTLEVQKDVITGSPYSAIEDEKSTLLFEALPAVLAEKFARNRDSFYLALARALSFRKQTVFGIEGFQIESQTDSHTKNLVWRVTTKKTPNEDPENEAQNKSENEPPQNGERPNVQNGSTSGFSDSQESPSVVCGGSHSLSSGKNSKYKDIIGDSEETAVTLCDSQQKRADGGQCQTTAYHRSTQNGHESKVPLDGSTSAVIALSEEGTESPICGGSFSNAEFDHDLLQEYKDLYLQVRQIPRDEIAPCGQCSWHVPDSGFEEGLVTPEVYGIRLQALGKSGDLQKVRAGRDEMLRKLSQLR
jgi:hypothetical protein